MTHITNTEACRVYVVIFSQQEIIIYTINDIMLRNYLQHPLSTADYDHGLLCT